MQEEEAQVEVQAEEAQRFQEAPKEPLASAPLEVEGSLALAGAPDEGVPQEQEGRSRCGNEAGQEELP
jgi:hypothetical protein